MSILYVLMILYQCVGHECTMGMICMLMLIIGCVEMAGVHDWGGDLNDSGNTYYACHLNFQGS